jgi:hypothetical protein
VTTPSGTPGLTRNLRQLGRLHVVLVHFPIALLIAAAAGESGRSDGVAGLPPRRSIFASCWARSAPWSPRDPAGSTPGTEPGRDGRPSTCTAGSAPLRLVGHWLRRGFRPGTNGAASAAIGSAPLFSLGRRSWGRRATSGASSFLELISSRPGDGRARRPGLPTSHSLHAFCYAVPRWIGRVSRQRSRTA